MVFGFWEELKRTKMSKYRVKALAYILIYMLATPFCLFLTLGLYTICTLMHLHHNNSDTAFSKKGQKKTILITGITESTKCLHICQILGKAGHTIVLAAREDQKLCSTRYSKYVSSVYDIPVVNERNQYEHYIATILKIVKKEKIDCFVPVSATNEALLHATLVETMNKETPQVKCLAISSYNQAATLDNKILFLKQCQKLGLNVPEFYEVLCIQDLVLLKERGIFKNKHFFLKPLLPYDEGREDFSRIPHVEKSFTKYIEKYGKKLCPEMGRPYFVCEFIKGKEFASNAICINGKTLVLQVSLSSAIQVNYEDVEHAPIKAWTLEFCKQMKITGCVSFDFLEDSNTGEIYCIECNPRLHSSIVFFKRDPKVETIITLAMDKDGNENEMAKHFLNQMMLPISPAEHSQEVYWLYHEVANVLLRRRGVVQFIKLLQTGKEAMYTTDDPVPFFISNTFQMIELLLHAAISGKRFKIPNHCLGKLY